MNWLVTIGIYLHIQLGKLSSVIKYKKVTKFELTPEAKSAQKPSLASAKPARGKLTKKTVSEISIEMPKKNDQEGWSWR